ncbi:MAG: DUF169 domain-containing protein [Dehalococcoidia bacterium]
MKKESIDRFIVLWNKYFNGAGLPVTFYYTDEEGHAEQVKPGTGPRCIIGALSKVRKGRSLCFDAASIACPGGKRYTGFTQSVMPDFEYFLSCGIPGQLEGERYKKSPDLVNRYMKHLSSFEAPGRMIVFKRWDRLEEQDSPEVAVFFATPDVLSGLFTLANFDEAEPDGVFSPFGSGCSSIVYYPYMERSCARPRGVIGMFDVSARPYVSADVLTFAVPMVKLENMMANMEESFLTTGSWAIVKKRIG